MDLPVKPAPPPEAPFFTAAPWKIILMSLCTSGFYEFYWFFQNWKRYRRRTREFIYPGWRAIFSPIWAYSFFKHIRESADAAKIKTQFDPIRLAVGYVLLFLAQYLTSDNWLALASLFTFVPIIIANNLAVEVDKAVMPDFRENDRLSVGNWVVVIVGGFLNVIDKLYRPNLSLQDLLSLNQHLMF